MRRVIERVLLQLLLTHLFIVTWGVLFDHDLYGLGVVGGAWLLWGLGPSDMAKRLNRNEPPPSLWGLGHVRKAWG